MTYFGFLLRFLVIPILILLFINLREKDLPMPGFDRRRIWQGILIHVVLALIYTTPWDNYLVATGVWYYNPDLVTGIVFGFVPLEEYTFFVLETILAGMWWWFLASHLGIPKAKDFMPSKTGRVVACGILFLIWLGFTAMFFSGWEPGTYLSIIFFWALPAIFPQFLYGADILWHHRKFVLLAILPLGTYLSLVDIIALQDTTWAISPAQTTGVLFFGSLPVEEVIFFFITNILIGFGMTLLLSDLGTKRFTDWKAHGYKGIP